LPRVAVFAESAIDLHLEGWTARKRDPLATSAASGTQAGGLSAQPERARSESVAGARLECLERPGAQIDHSSREGSEQQEIIECMPDRTR